MTRAERALERENKRAQIKIKHLERAVTALKTELAMAQNELFMLRGGGARALEMAVSLENGLQEMLRELE